MEILSVEDHPQLRSDDSFLPFPFSDDNDGSCGLFSGFDSQESYDDKNSIVLITDQENVANQDANDCSLNESSLESGGNLNASSGLQDKYDVAPFKSAMEYYQSYYYPAGMVSNPFQSNAIFNCITPKTDSVDEPLSQMYEGIQIDDGLNRESEDIYNADGDQSEMDSKSHIFGAFSGNEEMDDDGFIPESYQFEVTVYSSDNEGKTMGEMPETPSQKSVNLKLENKLQLVCSHCLYVTLHMSHLKTHIKNVHLMKKHLYCEFCKYRTGRKGDLNRHKSNVHLKKKDFLCLYCNYQTGRRCDLKRHIDSIHYKKKNFLCAICNYRAGRKEDLVRHTNTIHLKRRDFACYHCPYRAAQKANLRMHIEIVHLNVKNFGCKLCSYRTAHRGHLNHHVDTVHSRKTEFACKYEDCSFIADREGRLKFHINAVHLKKTVYSCNQCNYKAAQRGNLRTHVEVVHLKKRDFTCAYCPFKAGTKSNLKSHIAKVHFRFRTAYF